MFAIPCGMEVAGRDVLLTPAGGSQQPTSAPLFQLTSTNSWPKKTSRFASKSRTRRGTEGAATTKQHEHHVIRTVHCHPAENLVAVRPVRSSTATTV